MIERVVVGGKELPASRPIITSAGRGELEIRFTAPAFAKPESVQYSYMLEGFDKYWTRAGTRRVAYYTNLPHGEYRFRVRAISGETRTDSEANLPITLKPRYYQTFPFFVLLGIVIVGTCAAVYGWHIRQVGAHEQKLLILVDERTAALRESERQVRRSRDELDVRVQERTIELVRANQALETELFIWRQTERQLTSAKEEAEASRRTISEVLANLGKQLFIPLDEIRELTELRLTADPNPPEREYLETVRSSANFLVSLSAGILASADRTQAPVRR